MAKLDSKKIDSILNNLLNAAKGAVRSLNEMSDNEFKGSTLETDPLGSLGLIVKTLQRAQQIAAEQAQYEGKTVDEITVMQAAAREQELVEIQEKFNNKLAKRHQDVEDAKVALLAAELAAAEVEQEPNGDDDPDKDSDPDKDKEPQQ